MDPSLFLTASRWAKIDSLTESLKQRQSEMKVTTAGIDLAKNAFKLHGVDESGREALHKRLSRGKLLELLGESGAVLDRD